MTYAGTRVITYGRFTVTISYGWLTHSSTWQSYTVAMSYVWYMYTVSLVWHNTKTNVFSYGWFTISSVWHTTKFPMLSQTDDCQSVWHTNDYLQSITDDLLTHPYAITTIAVSCGWLATLSTQDCKNPIRLEMVDQYLRLVGIKRLQASLRAVWNCLTPNESQVSIFHNEGVVDCRSMASWFHGFFVIYAYTHINLDDSDG